MQHHRDQQQQEASIFVRGISLLSSIVALEIVTRVTFLSTLRNIFLFFSFCYFYFISSIEKIDFATTRVAERCSLNFAKFKGEFLRIFAHNWRPNSLQWNLVKFDYWLIKIHNFKRMQKFTRRDFSEKFPNYRHGRILRNIFKTA